MCITFDFTASIARLGGVVPSADMDFEGIDIVAHVAELKEDFDRTLYWRKPRGDTAWKGVRDGRPKYVARKKGDQYSEILFDLATDKEETHDLKDFSPDDFRRLKSMYDKWEATTRGNRSGRPGSE